MLTFYIRDVDDRELILQVFHHTAYEPLRAFRRGVDSDEPESRFVCHGRCLCNGRQSGW